jgi:hypothetical protein
MSEPQSIADLTKRECLVIEYLSPLMEASAAMVGKHVIERYGVVSGSGHAAVGAGLLGAMRKRGLVMLNELGWRLTQRGRHWAGMLRMNAQSAAQQSPNPNQRGA